ncbi:MAG: NADH-quinone oxidoreductase subunit J [Candidatus Omnitrophica bacterium]|nr:NADH-quinone oxidoreductase subunit J [Candidatus Omnitrophota bacterium]
MFSFFFYLFGAVLVLASLAVILARNPLYNVLSLVVVIFSLSSLFMLLEAFFVGIILLLVYAGAVLVFFLFVAMCLKLNSETPTTIRKNRIRLLGWCAGAAFLSELIFIIKSFLMTQTMGPSSIRGAIEIIGKILFTEYLLPFELTSLLLLIAVIGIVSLAKGAFKTDGNESGDAKNMAGNR